MRVFVMMGKSGEINSYECEEDTTVERLKETIFLKEGNILVQHQRLCIEGIGMENHRSLSHYNIKDGSTVVLTNLGLGRIGRSCFKEEWRLAAYYVMRKKICRKCYGRLPPNAERCRKAKCGRTDDIRWKCLRRHAFDANYIPEKLSEWYKPGFYRS